MDHPIDAGTESLLIPPDRRLRKTGRREDRKRYPPWTSGSASMAPSFFMRRRKLSSTPLSCSVRRLRSWARRNRIRWGSSIILRKIERYRSLVMALKMPGSSSFLPTTAAATTMPFTTSLRSILLERAVRQTASPSSCARTGVPGSTREQQSLARVSDFPRCLPETGPGRNPAPRRRPWRMSIWVQDAGQRRLPLHEFLSARSRPPRECRVASSPHPMWRSRRRCLSQVWNSSEPQGLDVVEDRTSDRLCSARLSSRLHRRHENRA